MRILLLAISLFLLEGFTSYHPKNQNLEARQRLLKKRLTPIRCSADPAAFDPAANPIPLLQGWGDYRMPVTGTNDSALLYFQQGINMYYGFHIIEALASFDKSIRFDSTFAMGYWGKALSYGPNINDYGYTASPAALAAAQKAKALAAPTTPAAPGAATTRNVAAPGASTTRATQNTPAERALIDAMLTRYSLDSTISREHLNQQYSDAMKSVYQKFPRNSDVAALYADALMQQHPWDLYDRSGKPKTWTPPIVATLEAILKANPKHPGAAHYYIHAVEASDHPERALAASDELPSLMPGVSHVVHMPAHIYIRTGNYARGWTVNIDAVKGYYDYLGKFPAVADNTPLYLVHNLHMLAACANMEGRYADAMKASVDTRNSFDSSWLSMPDFMGTYIQYIYMTPLLTQVRFGKWDDILAAPPLPAAYIYAGIITHYSRGIAFARKGRLAEAEQELAALQRDTANPQLFAPAPNYSNPGINGARVTERILAAVIAESRNNLPASIAALQKAIEYEDAMIYDEPKDWQQPARQFLGNVLLKAGRFKEAETAFRDDLRANPQNGWSYTGLADALSKQGRKTEAATAAAQAAKAFARSDIKITTAVL
ncbi:MAG TPA: tetratricopeptide repeat protein [Puia sp.]